MEHRRRTLSSALDDFPVDIEKQTPRRRGSSMSIDETLDDYTEYVYNGSFNMISVVFRGMVNLICPCLHKKKSTPIEVH